MRYGITPVNLDRNSKVCYNEDITLRKGHFFLVVHRDATKRKPEVLAAVVRWVDTRATQVQVVSVCTRVDSSRPPVAVGTLIVQPTTVPAEVAGQHKR